MSRLILTSDPGSRRSSEEESELVFDDEPLERILYGDGDRGPSPASMYAEANRLLHDFRLITQSPPAPQAFDAAARLAAEACRLSLGTCLEITVLLAAVVPQIPKPVLDTDLEPLLPLLHRVWRSARAKSDESLERQSGELLFRLYEHYGHYENAKTVLDRLAGMHVRNGNKFSEGIVRNNYAFEYYLQKRYREAAPLFQQAASLFESVGEMAECANSKANILLCRFEYEDLAANEEIEAELRRLAETLGSFHYWQARKPLILLARMAERQGRVPEAISWARQALEACRHSHTRYPEWDEEYLRHLENPSMEIASEK